MALPTLLDIARLNGNDKVVGLIEENLTFAPELNYFPTRGINGTQYTTNVRTGFPSVGFRSGNAGFAASKSVYEKRMTECFIFGGVIQADKMIADAYEDGAPAWQMIEADGVVKAALIAAGSQIWYGLKATGGTGAAQGFQGIKDFVAKTAATGYDAGGSTANTASSVYGVKFGIQNVIMPLGKNSLLQLGDFREQQISSDGGSTYFDAYVSSMNAWLGLQIGNVNCVGRIANVTDADGSTHSLSDSIIETWLAKYPVGYMPDMVFMSRRSRRQLQISRTVTLFGSSNGKPGGTLGTIAPMPTTTAGGIPIVATDSILNTDAIE